eukprot:GILK01012586.1.p1 GENE.GILK01012586.1~~GILK01012586.1.p1  ORF type:complete len:1074 (-),score=197.31 GILK01012586.1:49-2829(-)
MTQLLGSNLSLPHMASVESTQNLGQFTYPSGKPALRSSKGVLKNWLRVGTVDPGETVGDISILGGEHIRRSYTCVAMLDTQLLKLSRAAFTEFSQKYPQVGLYFLQTLIGRLWRVATFVLRDFFELTVRELVPTNNDSPQLKTECNWNSILAIAGRQIQLSMGDTLFEEGDQASSVFVVISGALCSFRAENNNNNNNNSNKESDRIEVTREIYPGFIVGGSSFFTGTERVESVKAMDDCLLVEFVREDFAVLVEQAPQFVRDLTSSMATVLSTTLHDFLSLGIQRMWCRAGQTVFLEGTDSDSYYIVISGRVRLLRRKRQADDSMASEEVVAEVGRGESFGEVSLLTNSPRPLSAFCVRDCEMVRISNHSWTVISMTHPRAVMKLAKLMATKIKKLSEQPDGRDGATPEIGVLRNLATIALVPASPNINIREFITEIRGALLRFGSTLVLDPPTIDKLFTPGISNQLSDPFHRSKVSYWVTVQEEDNRFILFVTDPAADSQVWSQFCVQQADCVLVVGDATPGSKPDLTQFERDLLWASSCRNFARMELVLLHPIETHHPKNTRRWLEVRRVNFHHHVRRGLMSDFSRLGRYLAGEAVGLVLGGGGARGLAHYGVLQALTECNVPIDFIGGTSQGAFMSAVYAMSLDLQQMKPKVTELATRLGSVWQLMKDLTLPILSYFSGRNMNLLIESIFEDMDVEDLWIKYFCISTSLATSDMVVHETGKLWRCVRSSMTVVGLLPPLLHLPTGDLLVDGGYVNNLPVDVMQRFSPKTIIANDVEDKEGPQMFSKLAEYGDSISGWRLFIDKFNPFSRHREKVPRFLDLFFHLTFICHNRLIKELLDNPRSGLSLYLRPPIGHFKLLDYDRMEEIFSVSRFYAIEEIKQWQLRNAPKKKLLKRSSSMPAMESLAVQGATSMSRVTSNHFFQI